ncbi:MAG: UDP-2,3-diacylglucosamine hydrolase [Flavobacteriales bacterium CG_4_10_14_0_2_um_filter_32_8]|nr:MAG: UDP-2,3-diacylglucosamine hydrolase [Flavobacteriales bacterium CG_4_10_14_0_2_um_filter_32_8]PJB14088.1 MAG: UDP-2,3-diacylglucosamine hydrolase [Flavobacteriales bacterium CG_4_9_14_3_um_filter_32_8]
MTLSPQHKIYFASDFHLGAPNAEESLKREKKLVAWLDQIKVDAQEIYLVGDIFDFWFEYKHAIPKGFVRLQGKIAELTDSGIPIHVFTGNHDMWIFDYLPKELGINLYREPILREYNGKKFLIGHGDGLGPGDEQYKRLKKVFSSKICQWAFARIHPNLGIGIANAWSKKSRRTNLSYDEKFHGEDNELLVIYCKAYLIKNPAINYFIFGHRHLPLDIKIGENTRYINLGEWIKHNSYAVFDGEKLELMEYGK